MDAQTWGRAFYETLLRELPKALANLPEKTSRGVLLAEVIKTIQKAYATVPATDYENARDVTPLNRLNESGANLLRVFGKSLQHYLLEAYRVLNDNLSTDTLDDLCEEVCYTVCNEMHKLHEQVRGEVR